MSDRRCDPLAMALSGLIDDTRRRDGFTYRRLGLPPTTVSSALDGHTARTSTFHRLADAMGYAIRVELVAKVKP